MTAFDLKDRHPVLNRLRRAWRRAPAGETDRTVLGGWLLSALLCLALAAPCPPPALPWAMAGLLSLSGLAWLALALVRGGPPAASPNLTAWDAALLSFAASFGVQAAARLGLFGT